MISLVFVVLVAATTSLAMSLAPSEPNLSRLFNDFEMSSGEHQANIQAMKKSEKLFLLGLFFRCMESDEFADCVDDSLAKKITKESNELDEQPQQLLEQKRSSASREANGNDSKEMLSLLRNALVKNIRLKSNIKTTRF
mgnify:CR=1 FL=1